MIEKNDFLLDVDLSKRIYGLDILRAVAIFLVLLSHGSIILPEAKFNLVDGVSLFFVLSGYLIGGILIKRINKEHTTKALFNFWSKRWFRTIPPYYFTLILVISLYYIFKPKGYPAPVNILEYFLFIQNFKDFQPLFFGEAWSLSVEEWFYIIVPSTIFLLLNILKVNCKKSILITIVSIIIVVTLIRVNTHYSTPITGVNDWDLVFRKQVITRLDSLVYGVLGAYITYYYNGFWNRFKKSFFIIGSLLFLLISIEWRPISDLYNTVFSFTIYSIATLCLLPLLTGIKNGRGVIYKSITFISLISYSMYLLNLTVVIYYIIIPFNFSHIPNGVRYILFWFLTIGLSTLMYKYVETPFMKLRTKLIDK